MAYDASKPADNQTIAQGPQDIRDNSEGLRTGRLVDAGALQGLTPGNANGNIPINNGNLNLNLNADKLDGSDASAFAAAGHTHDMATDSSAGFMSNIDKVKLDSIAMGAEVNQNTFGNILVAGTAIQADSKADTLELVPGTNIALTPDATNDRVTIAVTGKVAIADTAVNATDHIEASMGAHAASAISVTPTGNISSTTVQTAIAELDSGKVAASDVVTTATASKILKLDADGKLPANITGSAASAYYTS